MNIAIDQEVTKGLKTIYLHNSYIRNKRVQLRCDGHTNLIGGNGKGKTSMLNLLPVFAGVPPEMMMHRAGGKVSFLDYYLHNFQSMLVFDYEGHAGPRCVVMYRHPSGTKTCYRFVKGAAEETIFSAKFAHYFAQNKPSSEVLTYVHAEGIEVSRQIELTVEYIAILHNHTHRFRKEPFLRFLATDFALCGPKFSLKHIGELTRVPMTQHNLTEKFKNMLVDAYLSDESSVAGDKVFTNTHNLDFVDDVESLNEFVKASPELQKGAQLRVEVVEALKTLFHMQAQGNMLVDSFIEQEKEIIAQRTAAQDQYEIDSEQIQKVFNQLSYQITTSNGAKDAIESELTSLINAEQHYLEINIEGKKREYADLSRYEADFQNESAHLQRLQSSHQVQIDSHTNEVRKSEELVAKEVNALKANKDKVNALRITMSQERTAEVEALSNVLNTKAQGLNSKQNLEIETIDGLVEQAYKRQVDAEKNNAIEQRQLDQANKDIREQRLEVTAAIEKRDELKNAFELLSEKETKVYGEYQQADLFLKVQRKEEEALRARLNDEGTLLGFLRSSVSDEWHNNIGKLISPELLKSKKLNPVWADDLESQNTFYGLQLDTDQLEMPDEAENLDDLKIRIKKKEEQCSDLSKGLINLENRVQAIRKTLDEEAEPRLAVANTYLIAMNKRLDEYISVLERVETQIKKAKTERRAEAEKALGEVKRRKVDLKSNHTAEHEYLQTTHKLEVERIRGIYTEKDKQFDAELNQIDLQIESVSLRFKERSAELELALERALRAEGLDVEQMSNAKERVKQAEKAFNQVKSYLVVIGEYVNWISNHLSKRGALVERRDELVSEVVNLDKERSSTKEALTNLENRHTNQNNAFSKKLTELSSWIGRQNKLNKDFTVNLHDFSDMESDLVIDSVELPPDFDHYQTAGYAMLKQFEVKQQKSIDIYNKVQSILALARGNDLEAKWRESLAEDAKYKKDSLPYVLQAMKILTYMLKVVIPFKIETTIATYKSLGDAYKRHYDTLNRFRSTVRRISNDLSSNINTRNPFESISDLEIHLEAAITKYGYFKKLEAFVNKFDPDQRELPDENLLEVLRGAVNAMHGGNTESASLKSMVELSIRFKENGRQVEVKNDSDFVGSSSTGISRLVVLIIFTGLIRHLSEDDSVAIHLPIDELGQIDNANSRRLMALMKEQNVHLVCAQPEMSNELSKLFEYKFNVDKDHGLQKFAVAPKTGRNPLLARGIEQ